MGEIMSIALVVLTDGRGDYLNETIDSFNKQVSGNIKHKIIVNDSENLKYNKYLDEMYPDFIRIHNEKRLGLARAVQTAWTAALKFDIDYVFHLEEDFTFNEKCDLDVMVKFLERYSEYAELCLQRQAWSEEEKNGARWYGDSPLYKNMHDDTFEWFEHKELFSVNPCMIPRRILELGWPSGPIGIGNEDGFTQKCLSNGYKFAMLHHKEHTPMVNHIGGSRSEGWSL